MSQHVYARVSGFGWTLLPLAPFRFERVRRHHRAVMAFHSSAVGLRQARLTCEGSRPEVELGGRTNDLGEVLDLLPGPSLDHWRIETTLFTLRWPNGFAVESSPTPPGFTLQGRGGRLLYVQGPVPKARLPAPSEMVGPGQVLRRHGRGLCWSWVVLEYDHEGRPWLQSHRVLDSATDHTCVVTAQCPEKSSALVEAAADEVAASLSPVSQEEQLG